MTVIGRARSGDLGWNLVFRCPNCTIDLKVEFSLRQLFVMLLQALGSRIAAKMRSRL